MSDSNSQQQVHGQGPPGGGSFATIGHGRLEEPFKMYYEVHGKGPIRIVFMYVKYTILL
jgi:hypothetical protein